MRGSAIVVLTLVAACTIAPTEPAALSPVLTRGAVEGWTPDNPRYDEDGYELLPKRETMIVAWDYRGFQPLKVEVTICQTIVNRFETTEFLTTMEGHKLPLFDELMKLPPGRYEIRLRCWSTTGVDLWSEPYKISKTW